MVEIDVELVPMPPPAVEVEKMQGLRLNRRDAIVFGIGAGAGAFVTFLGYLIAQLSRPK